MCLIKLKIVFKTKNKIIFFKNEVGNFLWCVKCVKREVGGGQKKGW